MKKSRKKFWIVFTSVVLSVALVMLVFGLATRLKTITVEFRTRASADYTMLDDGITEKVISTGEFNKKKSLLFTDFDKHIANIEKANPYIKVEQVIRHFPNVVKVYISERIPKYRVRDTEDFNKWYILDADFKVLDMVTGGEKAVDSQNYGRRSSFYDVTTMVAPETLTISAYIGEFVESDELLANLNTIRNGITQVLGDVSSRVKSIKVDDGKFLLTMKNSGINDDNGCEILLEGSDNLERKAQAGALAFSNATSRGEVDLSGKIITISYENNDYFGIMKDKVAV